MKSNKQFNSISAYPLDWPDENRWPRTSTPKRSRFHSFTSSGRKRSKTIEEAQQECLNELNLLGAKNTIISTNVPVRKTDGLPYSNAAEPEDSGVAVYFTLEENPRCIPCDKWDRVADNIYAIAKTINALRGIDRWGTKRIIEAAFSGFKALPEHGSGFKWWEVLGVDRLAGRDEISRAFKKAVKKVHPDRPGGDRDKFMRLKEAYRQAKEHVQG